MKRRGARNRNRQRLDNHLDCLAGSERKSFEREFPILCQDHFGAMEKWARRAVDFLVAQSLSTRAVAHDVIYRYLDGAQLSFGFRADRLSGAHDRV